MKIVKVSDVARVRMGETLISKDLTGDGLPVYSAGKESKPWGFTSSGRLKLTRGTIVLSARGSIGFPKIPLHDHFTATQTTIVVEPSDRSVIDPEYLCYSLSLVDYGEFTRAAAIPMITVKQVSGLTLDLPQVSEQRRIVARIKECMERVEEVESLRSETNKERDALLESLIEAEFQSASGDEVVLEEVCGITSELVDPRKPSFIDSIHVGGANIESETGRLIDLKTSREEKLKSAKFPFDPSMVLYNKIRPYLKKVARPDFSGICSADMYPLSPNPTKLDKDYLFFLLLSRNFTRYAIEGSNRAGMPKVNRKHLFAYRFNLPPLDQQQQIAERLNEALTTLEIMRAEYLAMQTDESHLRDAILRKAFAGDL